MPCVRSVSYTHLPRLIHQRPLRSQRVTAWYAVGSFGITGPYFFEENGVTVTVNSARYIHMLQTFFRPELRRQRIALKNVWFQQDGATAHTANDSMNVLRRMFRGLQGLPTCQCVTVL